MSRAELEFRKLLEEEHIPKASKALTAIFDAGMTALAEGDVLGGSKALETFFKICGLIRKPTDDGAIAEMAKAIVGEMLVEARARRENPNGDASSG